MPEKVYQDEPDAYRDRPNGHDGRAAVTGKLPKKVLSPEEKRDRAIRRMTAWLVGPFVIFFFFLIWIVEQ
jgi:hypothetical protein